MVRDAVVQLVQRKLLLPCDRKFKKPHPGRTKLVKWPRTLEALRVRNRGPCKLLRSRTLATAQPRSSSCACASRRV